MKPPELLWRLAFAATLSSCATAAPPPPMLGGLISKQERPVASAATFNAATFASDEHSAKECEQDVTDLRAQSADVGWAALRACVKQGVFPEGRFTNLQYVLQPIWQVDLETRPEAAELALRLIALRGGDVEEDLRSFHGAKLPVFFLSQAADDASTFTGKLIIFRAKVEDVVTDSNGVSLKLSETTLHARGPAGAPQGAAPVQMAMPAGGTGKHGGSKYAGADMDGVQLTGRHVVATIRSQPLEKAAEYIFLARFSGAEELPWKGVEAKGAVILHVAVLSYAEPAALMIE